MSDRKRVLYVEDNIPSLMLVKQVLESAGYEVLEATDGMTGIRAAKEVKPDLILMDINMPGLDGYEAATRIKSLIGLSHTPIIAVTANVLEGDRERALAAGCDGYLPKPIDVDTLPQVIGEFLSGRRDRMDQAAERDFLREYSERLVSKLEEKIADLIAANDQLMRLDAMKSRFITIAAHELRTPITIIRGYIDILLEPDGPLTKTDPGITTMLEGVSNGVRRLHEIVEDMLDVSRIEAETLKLKCAPLRLATVTDEAIGMHLHIAERRKQTLIVEPMDHLPTIWGDGDRIKQILGNLISNAIKYTPDAGSIIISGRVMERKITPPPSKHPTDDMYVEITVADSGVGIDPGEQDRIFERFYEVRDPHLHSTSKTDFMGGGAGLGLAVARGVAEAHGGWIWVESEGYDPQRCPGSRFHVILPVGRPPDT